MTNIKTQSIKKYVTSYFSENLTPDHLFHTLDYTQRVVDYTEVLMEESSSPNLNKDATIAAAWFLNLGFIENYNDHKHCSCELAKAYLSKNPLHINASEVSDIIKAAWGTDEPSRSEVEILRDANTAFYGSKDFDKLMELERMELSNFSQDTYTSVEWREEYLEKLRIHHRYFTQYAIDDLKEQKESNILKLVGRIKKLNKTKKKEKLKVKFKDQSPERAIQSLYRTQLRNHIKLSDIADTKANILLSVNAIIISLLLANLIPALGQPKNSYLIYPTVIFVIFSIASMIMSVLATRPNIDNKKMMDGGISEKEMNYLFFGNFHAMQLPDFKQKIRDIIQSKDTIYDSLTMDLYYLGMVLKKKYYLLRWTYTIFIIGIILSVLAFALALKYFGMEDEIINAVTPDAPQ
ncbi:Pycsar system effector family protein [Flagellimonas crocea]|uniref:Pycsar system effector family protein n=1 Tax=Flagellimonas crocea TaxID=3067311 RepID=UPI00296E76A0|nr:Pycsar system effector family protein [Muricauda sp. DH64]